MYSTPRVALSLLLLFCTFGPALAQSEMQQVANSSADIVTVAANAQGVRFTSPNGVVQLRLEIYSELGQKLFDTEQRGGNVLDWHLQNGSGERLVDGTYLCVVTLKTLSGRLKQKLGLVTVSAMATAMRAATAAELSSQQTAAVGPVDGDNALTVMPNGESLPATAFLHTGQEAQLSRTLGALSFRLGDFFSGQHKEQMRLTEEGNLGIGTDKPQAKLDVAGTIRTSEGIEFANADGTKLTKLTTTATGGLQQTLADGTVAASATGTGTQNNIAKWTDNAGTLGDSSMFETSGRVGLGTTTPGAKFHVVGSQGSISAGTFQLDTSIPFSSFTGAYPAFELLNTNPTNNNVSLFQFSDAPSGAAHAGIGAVATNHATKFGDLFFFTKQADGYQARMGIYGGNVGIGTTTPRPGVRLEVNGATVVTPGNGLEMQLGAPNGETGLTLSKPTAPTARADVRFDGTTLKLFAGTGLVPPGNGIIIGTSGGATVTGTNGDGAVLTARRSGGDSFVIIDATPTSQNSVLAYRKNNLNRWLMFADSIPENGGNTGSDFQLDAYNDAGGGIANYLFIKRSTGNVGIGTTGPATRLAVNGGPTWTSNGWLGSLSMGNASALGWEANPSGQRFGIGQSSGGLYFFRTNSAFGTTGSPANYDMQITDTGNTTQPRDRGGLVKAMALVDPFAPAGQNITRCYNSIFSDSTATTPPCGIQFFYNAEGRYNLNFGFRVDDRFFSATAFVDNFEVGIVPVISHTFQANGTTMRIVMRHNFDDDYADSHFYIIVY